MREGEVSHLVASGADVASPHHQYRQSILYYAAATGREVVFRSCLKTPVRLDFTTQKWNGVSLLFLVIRYSVTSSAVASNMMKALCQRINGYPDDTIDWDEVGNHGFSFFTEVGILHQLSTFLPALREVESLRDRVISPGFAWRFDLETIPQAIREPLTVKKEYSESEHTAQLHDLTWCCVWDVEEWRARVQRGGDLLFCGPDGVPILLSVIDAQDSAIFRVCMETPEVLMFSRVTESDGTTILHYMFNRQHAGLDDPLDILDAYCERVEEHPAEEIVWLQKDIHGTIFFHVIENIDLRHRVRQLLLDRGYVELVAALDAAV